MGVIPSLKKIKTMNEVTNWKGQHGHKVFVGKVNGGRAKFTIEKSWWRAFVLEKLSKSVLKSNPKINLQLVTKRRGRLTRQEYFSGREIERVKGYSPREMRQVIEGVVKLHNSRVPIYLMPFAKFNFLKRVNSCIKRIKWSGVFTKEEIRVCESFFKRVPKATTTICHNDIQTGNVIKQKNGKLVLIDFGDANVGFKEAEIGRMITGFGWDKKGKEEFLKLYKESGGDINIFRENSKYWEAFGVLNKIRKIVQKGKTNSVENQKRLLQLKTKLMELTE